MKYIALLLLLVANCNLSFAIEPPKNAIFGAKVLDLDSGEVLYELNADVPLIPASNQKIVTTYAALKLLNPESKFQTALYSQGKIANGVLHGDLYVKFSGDPELTYKDLSALFEKLNVNSIKGVVYIDDEDFDNEYFGHGWSHDQIKFCFSAPISAIMIDKNCELYKFEKHHYVPERQPHFTTLKNRAKQTPKNQFCELELDYSSENHYELNGCYIKDELPSRLYIATRDPHKLGIDVIKTLLKAREVKFSQVKFAPVSAQASLIAAHDSLTLKQLLVDMMKDSDNQSSEVIFKLISKVKLQKGTWKNSAQLVTKLLKDELGDVEFIVKDGSGGSRKNLISPSVLVSILEMSKDNENFVKTFPQAGDGTLKNRFKNKSIFAKTGTIDNVSALSGYIFLENGRKIAFSLIINNCISDKSLKKFEEDFLYDILTKIS